MCSTQQWGFNFSTWMCCVCSDIQRVLREDREKLRLLQKNQPRFSEEQKKELMEVHPWIKKGGLPKAVDIKVVWQFLFSITYVMSKCTLKHFSPLCFMSETKWQMWFSHIQTLHFSPSLLAVRHLGVFLLQRHHRGRHSRGSGEWAWPGHGRNGDGGRRLPVSAPGGIYQHWRHFLPPCFSRLTNTAVQIMKWLKRDLCYVSLKRGPSLLWYRSSF